MSEYRCEMCNDLMGTMSREAWLQAHQHCELCIDECEQCIQESQEAAGRDRHNQAKYDYACGYHD